MLRVGVTGGIACGKSLVGSILEEVGVAVCEADMLAHRAMVPGQAVYQEIVAAFGPGILGDEQCIDRVKLGALVFADAGIRDRLNAIVHPRVVGEWQRWCAARQADGCDAAFVIVPLLFEGGFELGWHRIVCVGASGAVQRRRMKERGLFPDESRLRIQAQWSVSKKEALADFVIRNDGSVDSLRSQTQRILGHIVEK